jgi:hypothetical protein
MDGRFFLPGAIAPVPQPRQDELAAAAPAGADATTPLHDPSLAPRDEAVFLLTAAEVEHALMVPRGRARPRADPRQDPASSDPRQPDQPVRGRSLKPLIRHRSQVLEPHRRHRVDSTNGHALDDQGPPREVRPVPWIHPH